MGGISRGSLIQTICAEQNHCEYRPNLIILVGAILASWKIVIILGENSMLEERKKKGICRVGSKRQDIRVSEP